VTSKVSNSAGVGPGDSITLGKKLLHFLSRMGATAGVDGDVDAVANGDDNPLLTVFGDTPVVGVDGTENAAVWPFT
jgi:hypothetical protein